MNGGTWRERFYQLRDGTLLKGTAEHGDDGKTAQRIYQVRYATKPDDADEVLSATGIPTTGAAFKTGDSRTLKKKQVASLGTVLDYLVTCDYEVPKFDAEYNENPTSRPDEISGDFSTELKTYFKDTEGTKVVNSVGEPFDDLPQRYAGTFRFKVKGNRSTSTNVATWASYVGPTASSYNNGSVTIRGVTFAAKALLLLGMSFTVQKENQYTYQAWEWDLGVNVDDSDGWSKQKIDDRGYHHYDAGEIRPITIGEPPEPVQTPWPLDGDQGKKPNIDDDPAELPFKPYFARDFSIFGFTS